MVREINPEMWRRILVSAPNWIGDAVMCSPALKGIRQAFPSAEICVLARPAVADLLRDHSCLDNILVCQYQGRHASIVGQFRLARELHFRRFDLAVLFPNSFSSALTVFLARIPHRVGYPTDGRSFLLTHAVPLPPAPKTLHQVCYYEELIRPFCSGYSSQSPELHVSKDDERQADTLLASMGLSADRILLAVNPGAMYGGAKRWLPERFAEAADQLIQKLGAEESPSSEIKCVIVGAPGEEGLGREVARRMQREAIVLSGQTSLGALKALIKRCRLYLTNDTGPMHIANALNVPVVAVFGPTDHTTTSPFSPGHVVVRTPVDCSPCLLRECPIDHRCMTGVTVEQVVQAAAQILPKSRVAPFHTVQPGS